MNKPTDWSAWEDVAQIPDEELWRAHERCRERLVGWARQILRDQLTKRGAAYDDVNAADQVLDPEALTIGFARRFATYKRGTLLFRDMDRLRRLLDDTKRPIQFVFAGKAHPADHEGKELIKQRGRLAQYPPPAVRSQWHQRHEGGGQRCAELLGPRRVVGRRIRPQPRGRLGHRPGRKLL